VKRENCSITLEEKRDCEEKFREGGKRGGVSQHGVGPSRKGESKSETAF